jgi:anti-sigma regulatory factor (Ser/Thr protein kinase)/serine/threonine protein phosphatase PrpC
MARDTGFRDQESEEIALAVSELATNLVQHAGGGVLTLTPLTDGARVGLQIESVDRGPGIPDVERAIADGFSTTGSLGYGLGTVNRLMDELEIESGVGRDRGTRIVCTRWLRPEVFGMKPCPLDFGAATRPHPGIALNGDAFVIQRWGESALVAVIDGLGHGQYAHRAAQKARGYVERHFDQPPISVFRGAGRACRATRGVVMALARFDCGIHGADLRTRVDSAIRTPQSKIGTRKSEIRLTFATVGNVEARVFGSLEPISFLLRRGIVGLNAPNPVVTEHRWDPSYVMVLHSDGLTTHWRWEDFYHLASKSATVVAQELLRALAKDNDDATVVVVKGAGGQG